MFTQQPIFAISGGGGDPAGGPRGGERKAQNKKTNNDALFAKLLNGDIEVEVPAQSKMIKVYLSANSKGSYCSKTFLLLPTIFY